MSKVKKGVYNFLRGSFLTDESSLKNWRVIVFIVALLLIMISSGHSAEKKVYKIYDLNKKKRELRAKSRDIETVLTKMEMESSIKDEVKKRGLKPSQHPPKKINVTYKN